MSRLKRFRLFSSELQHNAQAGDCDRERHLAELERDLARMRDTPTPDARCLRGVIRGATSLISPPRSASFHSGVESFSDAELQHFRQSADFQARVRTALIGALLIWKQHWCEDVQIEPMVQHVKNLILSFAARYGSVQSAAASTQWLHIQTLMHTTGYAEQPSDVALEHHFQVKGGSVSQKLLDGIVDSSHVGSCSARIAVGDPNPNPDSKVVPLRQRKIQRARRLTVSTASKIAPGAKWTPTEDICALPNVKHMPDDKKDLRCTKCTLTMRGEWFFVHPKRRIALVLTPPCGHSSCNGAPIIPADGSPFKRAMHRALDFCEHHRVRIQCKPCGGEDICPHGRQKNMCKECGGSSICVEHRKQRNKCKYCRHLCKKRSATHLVDVTFSCSQQSATHC